MPMTTNGWRIPTMRTQEQHTVPVVVDQAACCGKTNMAADMLRYVGNLSPDLRTAAKLAPDVVYICDGCWETILREGWLAHDELYVAMGAPPQVVADIVTHMESWPVRAGSRGHAQKLKHHPHLKPETA